MARMSLDLLSDAIIQPVAQRLVILQTRSGNHGHFYSTSGTPSSSMPLPRLTGVKAV